MKVKVLCLSLFAFFLFSCSNQDLTNGIKSNDNGLITTTSNKINELKEFGVFDEVSSWNTRSVDESKFNVDISKVHALINQPEESLKQLLNEENGETKLQLVNLMLTEGSVGEIINTMEMLDPQLAADYEKSLSDFIENIGIDTSRGLEKTSIGSIYDIKLRLIAEESTSRGAYAADLSWNTIQWYIGFSAATIAGLSAYKWCGWWQPWVGVAGLATAGAGTASMLVQLGIWYGNTSDLKKFVSSVQAKGSSQSPQTVINNSEISQFGSKIATVLGTTAGVAVFVAVYTPELAGFVSTKLISGWNTVYNFLFGWWVPAGFIPTFNGISIIAL